MNAWLRSPALLHVIAEHALRNAGSTELEIWYRDLCVTGQSPGHLQGRERRRAQLHVTRGWAGGPSGCPYRVAEGEARKFPGAKGNSGRHPPCGIPGKGELACCLHRSPFLAGAGGDQRQPRREGEPQRSLCGCRLVGGAEGEAQAGICGQKASCVLISSMPSFPLSLWEIQSMGGSWNRVQCECQGEDSGGHGVHMPLPGLVSLIFSHQLFFLCLTFRKLFMNFIGSCEEVVSAVAVFSLPIHVFPALTFLSSHYVSFLFDL